MIKVFFIFHSRVFRAMLHIVKEINKETLKVAARKMMFEISDEECENLLAEMDIIVSEMNIIRDIEGVDEQEPMVFPFDVTNSYLREDIPESTLSKKDALKNAKKVDDGMIGLPRVVK